MNAISSRLEKEKKRRKKTKKMKKKIRRLDGTVQV